MCFSILSGALESASSRKIPTVDVGRSRLPLCRHMRRIPQEHNVHSRVTRQIQPVIHCALPEGSREFLDRKKLSAIRNRDLREYLVDTYAMSSCACKMRMSHTPSLANPMLTQSGDSHISDATFPRCCSKPSLALRHSFAFALIEFMNDPASAVLHIC